MSGVEIWGPLQSFDVEDHGQEGEATWFVCKGDQDHDTYFGSRKKAQECADALNEAEAADVHPHSFDPDKTATLVGAR